MVPERRVFQEVAAASVDTDTNGDFTVTFDDLRDIESKANVTAQAEEGYVTNVQSVTGNAATVRVFQSASGSTAEALSAVNASNVTNVNATAWGK